MTRVTSFTNKRLSTNLAGVAKLPALPHLMLPQTRVRSECFSALRTHLNLKKKPHIESFRFLIFVQ